jgi:hypothetical protein
MPGLNGYKKKLRRPFGQAEAGIQTGGDYGLGGGFWGGGPLTETSPISNLFLPVLIK